MKSKFSLSVFGTLLMIHTYAQTGTPPSPATNSTTAIQVANMAWYRGGNNNIGFPNSANDIFGTMWNSPVYHYTGGSLKFTTTVNNGINIPFTIFNTPLTLMGDGIRIQQGNGSVATSQLQLFTSTNNTSYVKFGESALLGAQAVRFENIANLNGFWYDATGNGANGVGGQFIPQYIWNIRGNEHGRLGSNGWWCFGRNGVNANNVVEISTFNNPTAPYGVSGSGLRFTNLTSNSSTINNGTNGVNNTKVLTVDQNGDVVLTNVNSGAQLCNGIATDNVVKYDQTTNQLCQTNITDLSGGLVGINKTNPQNCLEIFNLIGSPLAPNPNNGGTGASGLRLSNLTSASIPAANGVTGINNTKMLTVDQNGDVVLTFAPGGSGNFPGTCSQPISMTSDGLIETNGYNLNFSSTVNPSGNNNLGNFNFGDVNGCGNQNLARVWIRNTFASSSPTNPAPNVALRIDQTSTTPGTFALEAIGNVNIIGFGWINGMAINSDKRFKTNIQKMESPFDKIEQINGYTYQFRTEEFQEKNFSDREQIGFIAQELKEVFPQLVTEDQKGYLAVNYQGMIPVLLEAIKEDHQLIKSQQEQIDALSRKVDELLSLNQKNGHNNLTTIGNNPIILNQNAPNPFAESTVITYAVNSDFTKANIVFTDASGKIVHNFEIKEKGTGSLTVFADNLSTGTYTYSIVVDGNTVESRKMIKY